MKKNIFNEIKRDMVFLHNAPESTAEGFGIKILSENTCIMMKSRLIEQHFNNRHDWWKEEVSIELLKEYLQKNVDSGDMLDVINLAAMILHKEIHQRQEQMNIDEDKLKNAYSEGFNKGYKKQD